MEWDGGGLSWHKTPANYEEYFLGDLAVARELFLKVLASEGEDQQYYLCDAQRAFGIASQHRLDQLSDKAKE